MFIGRERELQTLERLFYSDHFEFAVIYGRRRVGKHVFIRLSISIFLIKHCFCGIFAMLFLMKARRCI